MGELTSEEMARLRVRLADLPGFDATGLVLRDDDGSQQGIVVYDDGRDVLVHPEDGDREPAYWTKDQDSKPHTRGDEEPHVSTADARTRDALARWVAERLGKPAATCGPCFGAVGNSSDGRGWAMLPRLGHGMLIFMRPDRLPVAALPPLVPGGESVWNGVPGLGDLNVFDDRRLPDGSRWVDAAALAAVCGWCVGRERAP